MNAALYGENNYNDLTVAREPQFSQCGVQTFRNCCISMFVCVNVMFCFTELHR